MIESKRILDPTRDDAAPFSAAAARSERSPERDRRARLRALIARLLGEAHLVAERGPGADADDRVAVEVDAVAVGGVYRPNPSTNSQALGRAFEYALDALNSIDQEAVLR
jgi:hypothetical protein